MSEDIEMCFHNASSSVTRPAALLYSTLHSQNNCTESTKETSGLYHILFVKTYSFFMLYTLKQVWGPQEGASLKQFQHSSIENNLGNMIKLKFLVLEK
jgi:hypothetical protein